MILEQKMTRICRKEPLRPLIFSNLLLPRRLAMGPGRTRYMSLPVRLPVLLMQPGQILLPGKTQNLRNRRRGKNSDESIVGYNAENKLQLNARRQS